MRKLGLYFKEKQTIVDLREAEMSRVLTSIHIGLKML